MYTYILSSLPLIVDICESSFQILSPLVFFYPPNTDATSIPSRTSKLFISVTLYHCGMLTSVFLDLLIVSVAGSLRIHSGLCVKMNASCMIHLSNRYSDQLNLRTGLILTKQDHS